jgi:hypothetical protein
MERTAKIFSWLGIAIATVLLAKTVTVAFRFGGAFMSYEPLAVVLVPFGLALLALSKHSNKWLIRLALVFNGIVVGFCVLVLLGEFAWHMLGPRFVALFAVFVLTPGVLNYVAVSRRRKAIRAANA